MMENIRLDLPLMRTRFNLNDDASELDVFIAAYCEYHQCQRHIGSGYAELAHQRYVATKELPFFMKREIQIKNGMPA